MALGCVSPTYDLLSLPLYMETDLGLRSYPGYLRWSMSSFLVDRHCCMLGSSILIWPSSQAIPLHLAAVTTRVTC